MKQLVLSLFSVLILCSCQNQFNQEKWLNNPKNRGDMVTDLVKENKLEGMTENQVIKLLGEPEQRIDKPTSQFVYYLGRAGLGVDDSLLKIEFDIKGTLKSYRITSD